jgi:ribonuclease Z
MNAKNVLLTHFSARHPKLPPSITREMAEAGPDAKQLIVPAFDLLNLKIGDMWKIPFYIPVLYHNFRETVCPELDETNSRSSSPVAESSTAIQRNIRVAMTG